MQLGLRSGTRGVILTGESRYDPMSTRREQFAPLQKARNSTCCPGLIGQSTGALAFGSDGISACCTTSVTTDWLQPAMPV